MFFDTAPVSRYVVNEGADIKVNSMHLALVDIENVVIMWWAFHFSPSLWLIWTRPTWSEAITVATLTNLDQPVLAYKCWCRERYSV